MTLAGLKRRQLNQVLSSPSKAYAATRSLHRNLLLGGTRIGLVTKLP